MEHKITFKNFHENTRAIFKFKKDVKSTDIYLNKYGKLDTDYMKYELEKIYPNMPIKLNFISKRSVYYEIGKSKLARISQHWSDANCGAIRSCWWEISEPKTKYKWKIGVVSLKNFEIRDPIQWVD